MRKKGGKKKHNSSRRKKKIFFFNSKVAPAVAVIVFLAFAILLGFMNKTGQVVNTSITGQQVGTNFISNMFANWNAGTLDANIAKYLFWFMVTILVWSILSFAKFPQNGVFQAFIAIPVGFLATAYLTPAEIFTVLQSYETLGIVLTFIVPFMLMLFFSSMLLSNQKIRAMSVPKIMFEVFLWVFFVVILGYKIVSGITKGQIPLGLNLTILIMVGVFFLSFLILVFNRRFRRWVWNIGNDLRGAQREAERVEAEAAVRTARATEKAERR